MDEATTDVARQPIGETAEIRHHISRHRLFLDIQAGAELLGRRRGAFQHIARDDAEELVEIEDQKLRQEIGDAGIVRRDAQHWCRVDAALLYIGLIDQLAVGQGRQGLRVGLRGELLVGEVAV